MDIQTITRDIQNKLTHVANIKSQSYSKTLSHLSPEEQETKMSTFITEITFDVSEKVIKDKLSKMNPKPIAFSFFINREKYFEQTIKELTSQLRDEVYFDAEELEKQKEIIHNKEYFIMNFAGHFLSDYGYIGKKNNVQDSEIKEKWFPAVLACLKVKDMEADEAEKTLSFLKEFIIFGFNKAIGLEYVFVDNDKFAESLNSVEYVMVGDTKMTSTEFDNYRKNNAFGIKKK